MNAQQTAALTTAGGFGLIVAFQVALALGAPFGAAAWGGTTPGQLPTNLRIASAIADAVWASAAVIVLSRAGFDVVALPADLTWWGTWVIAGLLTVGAVMNVASASPWERYGWAPFSLVPRSALLRGGAHAPDGPERIDQCADTSMGDAAPGPPATVTFVSTSRSRGTAGRLAPRRQVVEEVPRRMLPSVIG